MLQTLKTKLTSRKFLAVLVSAIVGILGLVGADDSIINLVSSVGLILIPTVVYIFVEGKIDASALSTIDVTALIDTIKKYIEDTSDSSAESTTDTAITGGDSVGQQTTTISKN